MTRGPIGLVLTLAVTTTVAGGPTIIDMPAPKGHGTQERLGEVALHRYSAARVFPRYTYRSPSIAWPYAWSGWRVGWPYGYGWGWPGWGWGWGWPGWGWGWRGVWGWRSFGTSFGFGGFRGW